MTNAKTAKTQKPAAKKPAAAPAAPQGDQTVAKVTLPAPVGPRYLPNMQHPGCANMRGHRGYAWATVLVLAKAMPEGFALNQLKAALVGNVLPAGHQWHAHGTTATPNNGWQAHNMPQWGAKPANAWWVKVPGQGQA